MYSVNFVVSFSAMEDPHKRVLAGVRNNKGFHYSCFLTRIFFIFLLIFEQGHEACSREHRISNQNQLSLQVVAPMWYFLFECY